MRIISIILIIIMSVLITSCNRPISFNVYKKYINDPKNGYLKELEMVGIVESQKVGRETLYINKELIEILKQKCTKA